MTPDEFRSAQARLQLSDQELADRLGRSVNMVRRYKANGARGRPIPDEVKAALSSLTVES